jgi:hypothetical protein
MKDTGWTVIKASNFLASKFMYDDYVYNIMCDIVDEMHPTIIINRNPTITLGSILLMRIRRVKPDPKDVTLSMPSAVLPALNADLTSQLRSA